MLKSHPSDASRIHTAARGGLDLRPPATVALYGVQAGYQEYVHLWAKFEQLLPTVVRQNRYFTDLEGNDYIPRLQDLGPLTPELQEYQRWHIALWKRMERTIDKLSRCEYVQRRYPGTAREYADGLTELIN